MNTIDQVISIIREALRKSPHFAIKSTDSLFDDLYVDGDKFDNILSAIESTFAIDLDEDAIDTFDSPQDIADYIERNR